MKVPILLSPAGSGARSATTGVGPLLQKAWQMVEELAGPSIVEIVKQAAKASLDTGEVVQATDSSKNEQHGDGGRALDKADKQIAELEAQLVNAPKKERERIKKKIRRIRTSAQKKKGENHSQKGKR